MDKFNESQVLKLSLVALLLVITPLLSSSLRPKYLYFIVNLLIIALGAEAGLLSFFSKQAAAAQDRKRTTTSSSSSTTSDVSPGKPKTVYSPATGNEGGCKEKPAVDKCSSEKIFGAIKVQNFKKCPSTPSIFFIGGNNNKYSNEATEAEEMQSEDDDYDNDEEFGGLSGQELFTKAETFIGNFYKQLKMQREESWKKIHGLYHKAF